MQIEEYHKFACLSQLLREEATTIGQLSSQMSRFSDQLKHAKEIKEIKKGLKKSKQNFKKYDEKRDKIINKHFN